MVVAEQNRVADVVFVVEATANLSPYIENLKANYIIPTLEHFNGGPPDDRDFGCDYNSTLYALVVFMAADCIPEPASACYPPTPSTFKFISCLDRVMFIGGGGESCSHIAEGLSTVLQVFEDFQQMREPGVVTQKQCILVCNSPPYPIPALESLTYSGLMAEQLASLMSERQINFSILSPRKIPALLKLYEKAGGDLQLSLAKNYAKDRRHLVLLKGYQLQERPASPPPLEPKLGTGSPAPVQARSPTSSGMPTTTLASSTQSQPTAGVQVSAATVQAGPLYPQPGVRPVVPTSHLASLNQPNPPNVTITNKGHQLGGQPTDSLNRPASGQSPVQMVSTPPPTSLLASQLAGRQPSTQVQQQQNPTLASLVSQPPAAQPGLLGPGGGGRQGVQIRVATPPQQPTPPNALPPGQGPLSMQLNQLPGSFAMQQSQVPISVALSTPQNIASKVVTSTTNTMGNQPGLMSTAQMSMPNVVPGPITNLNLGSGISGVQPQQNIMKDRQPVWQGVIEYQEKPGPGGNPTNRVSHTFHCTILSTVVNGEVEVSGNKWPPSLNIQMIPKQLMVLNNLFNSLKNAARQVFFQFVQDSEGLQKLTKVMSSGYIGVIQFPAQSDIRIMIVLYTPDKRLFSGVIANDQEGFYNGMRQMYENHRKQQQVKQQKMMLQVQQNQQPQQMFAQGGMSNPYQQLQQMSGGSAMPAANTMPMPVATQPNPQGLLMNQQPNAMSGNTGQIGARPPLSAPGPQPGNAGPPPSQPTSQQASANMLHNLTPQQQQSRLSALEVERQQNLMKIQQLQQTLEAAQQKEKELQYKAAQEHQHQHQQQQVLLRQEMQRQRQQLQQQQQLQQLQQQQQQQINQQTGTNPQLRHLLQQVPQMRQQILIQQQQPGPGIRGQMPPGGIAQQPTPQQPQQQQQQHPPPAWDDASILDLI